MPSTWSKKDEKQYQHIKESERDRGASVEKAQENCCQDGPISKRRKEGRTPKQTTEGTGNPNSRLEDRTVDELQNLAAQYHITGRSKMLKAELIEAISR